MNIMSLKDDIDWRSLIIGAAISAACVILASQGLEWLYLFTAVGLIYVGYNGKNIIYGTVLGAIASLPIVFLAFRGDLGQFTGFFTTTAGSIALTIIILLVGAFVGFVGAWAKRDRVKAKEEYEKRQKIGKNKNKKVKTTEQKTGFLNKILKK